MSFLNIFNVIACLLIVTGASGQPTGGYTEADTTVANTYFSKAIQHFIVAKYDSSIYCFAQTAMIYETLANRSDKSRFWEKVMKCKINIGEVSRIQADYVNAIRYGKEALEMGLQKFGENHPDVNKCYNNLGVLYCERADFDLGLQSLNRAIEIKKRLYGENSPDVAITYNSIGSAYNDKGDLDQAIEYYEKALSIRQETLTEKDPYLASSYSNIAASHHLKGDYDQALAFYGKALTILLAAYEGENHHRVANCYSDMGSVYYDSGSYEQAIAYHLKALPIIKSTMGESHYNVAETYEKLGNVYLAQEAYQNAREFYEQSVTIFRETYGEEHPSIAIGYNNIGNASMHLADSGEALSYLNKSLVLWRGIHGEGHPGTARVYHDLARLHLRLGDFQDAAFNIQSAIKSLIPSFKPSDIEDNPQPAEFATASSTIDLLDSFELKAAILCEFNHESSNPRNLQHALSTYELAANLIDRIRTGYRAEGSKLLLGARKHRFYEKAIETAIRLYEITGDERYTEKAFFFTQKGKASVMTQSLQESLAKSFANIPDSLVETERQLRIDFTFYETALQKERLKKNHQDSLRTRELEARVFSIKQSYDKLIDMFDRDYREYHELKYSAKAATMAELQNSLDGKTVLIEYFIGDHSVYSFVITNSDFLFFQAARDSSFDAQVKSLVASFRSVASKDLYQKRAFNLYLTLIQPASSTIATKSRLVIMPDGELHQIPFEALLTAIPTTKTLYTAWPYLVKRYEIAYQPSATLYLRNLAKADTKKPENQFVGFAPVFKNNGNLKMPAQSPINWQTVKEFWQSVMRDGENLQELKFSAGEVKEISRMFGDGQSKLFLNEGASEKNFKNEISPSRFVHVATHGLLKDESPKLSGLAFSQNQNTLNPVEDDGFLYSGEAYNLDMDVDLLVLSACQSGSGALVRGEGLMALTRGFLYSGARHIIASLWKVFDQHTSQMMIELYRQILSGKSYSAALRQAKLQMIANPETAGPQSWAAFVLIGR